MLRIFFYLFIVMLQLPVQATAQGYQIERSFYQDTQNEVLIDSIANVQFQPYAETLRLGYQSGATWIRLKISPPVTQGETARINNPLILRVSPHYLDQIDVYQLTEGTWQLSTAGDLYKKTNAICADDTHCFTLQALQPSNGFVYLKIQTKGLAPIQTEVKLTDELMGAMLPRIKKVTGSFAISVLLLVIAFIFVLITRSILTYSYFLCQTVITLYIFISTGGLAESSSTWRPETLNLLLHFLFVLRVAMIGLVGWGFLYSYSTSQRYRNWVFLYAVGSLLSLLLICIDEINTGLAAALILFLINPFVQIVGIFSVAKMTQRVRVVLLAVYALYIFMAYFGCMVAMGWFRPLTEDGLLQHIADVRLNGLLIAFLTFWAVITEQSQQKIDKLKEIQKLQLNAAQAQANQTLVNERNALIDMLTHELKTPLSTIRFALSTLKSKFNSDDESIGRVQRIDSSVVRMNAMIEHVALSNKIERTVLEVSSAKIPATELMDELIGEFSHPERFDLKIEHGSYFMADRQMLILILENLLSNAYKYSADLKIVVLIDHQPQNESELSRSTSPQVAMPTVTRFEISNNVAADSEPDEARLFERYYRHPNFQNHSGMGIGLSLVHSAAEKMGAIVSYKHENGRVIFEVRIPN
jgi:signal transduction histidine kinase